MKDKKLRVVHLPNVGVVTNNYVVDVKDLDEAYKVMNVIAYYDLFLLEEGLREDFSNAMFLEEYDEEEKDWVSWVDDETGIDDLFEYVEFIKENE